MHSLVSEMAHREKATWRICFNLTRQKTGVSSNTDQSGIINLSKSIYIYISGYDNKNNLIALPDDFNLTTTTLY